MGWMKSYRVLPDLTHFEGTEVGCKEKGRRRRKEERRGGRKAKVYGFKWERKGTFASFSWPCLSKVVCSW